MHVMCVVQFYKFISWSKNMINESAEFVIYIINAIANAKNLYPSHVYKVLHDTGCIQKYIVPFYDVLYTMGTNI